MHEYSAETDLAGYPHPSTATRGGEQPARSQAHQLCHHQLHQLHHQPHLTTPATDSGPASWCQCYCSTVSATMASVGLLWPHRAGTNNVLPRGENIQTFNCPASLGGSSVAVNILSPQLQTSLARQASCSGSLGLTEHARHTGWSSSATAAVTDRSDVCMRCFVVCAAIFLFDVWQ